MCWIVIPFQKKKKKKGRFDCILGARIFIILLLHPFFHSFFFFPFATLATRAPFEDLASSSSLACSNAVPSPPPTKRKKERCKQKVLAEIACGRLAPAERRREEWGEQKRKGTAFSHFVWMSFSGTLSHIGIGWNLREILAYMLFLPYNYTLIFRIRAK